MFSLCSHFSLERGRTSIIVNSSEYSYRNLISFRFSFHWMCPNHFRLHDSRAFLLKIVGGVLWLKWMFFSGSLFYGQRDALFAAWEQPEAFSAFIGEVQWRDIVRLMVYKQYGDQDKQKTQVMCASCHQQGQEYFLLVIKACL